MKEKWERATGDWVRGHTVRQVKIPWKRKKKGDEIWAGNTLDCDSKKVMAKFMSP